MPEQRSAVLSFATQALALAIVVAFTLIAASPVTAGAHDDADRKRSAVARCRTLEMRQLDAYRRGIVHCAVVAARSGDVTRFQECRRERLIEIETKRAEIELATRRIGAACPLEATASVAGDRAWAAALLDDMGATTASDGTCRSARILAVERFVRRAGRCAMNAALAGEGIDGCLTTATRRFSGDWSRRVRAGCTRLAFAEIVARVIDGVTADTRLEAAVCGNGRVEEAEECDDRNTDDGDGCTGGCRAESCSETDGAMHCARCPAGATVSPDDARCVCAHGYALAGLACIDVDECATGNAECPSGTTCRNVAGSYACAVPCTQEGLVAGIAACGGPAKRLTFDCRDAVIRVADTGDWGERRVRCDGLEIDGLDSNVTFALDPPCFEAAGATCPDVDEGTGFLLLEGDDITVRNLTVRWFFDGIQSRGRRNTVERVSFDRHCDDALTNAATGVGTLFRGVSIREGCDKCAQGYGDPALTSVDPASREHYHAIFEDVDFAGCAQPLRMTSSGRFLIDGARMFTPRASEFACRGPFFSAPDAGTLAVTIRDSIVSGCRRGIRVGGAAEVVLENNLVEGSGLAGIRVFRDAKAHLARNRILANGGRLGGEGKTAGIVVADRGAVDVGGGALPLDSQMLTSPGGNLLCGNVSGAGAPLALDASALSNPDAVVAAAGNWWCDQDPSRVLAGRVDVTPFADFPR